MAIKSCDQDTVVGGGEVLVQHPLDDVLDVAPERVAHTRVHIILSHLIIRHEATLATIRNCN